MTLLPYEQDSARLARLLASADALVHAGAHETFGMIVIEAMACGLPVIGMRAGGVAELIDESIGELAEPSDADSLCEAIERGCARNLAQMGKRARKRIEQRYTWASTFDLQLDRYARLAQARSRFTAPTASALEPVEATDMAGSL